MWVVLLICVEGGVTRGAPRTPLLALEELPIVSWFLSSVVRENVRPLVEVKDVPW